jgi:Protein of unknown function (DUF2917)
MTLALVNPVHSPVRGLHKGQLLAVAGQRGARIESRRGAVWVTQDGNPDDVVLDAGQVHVLERNSPVLIQALDAACVAVQVPVNDAAAPLMRAWQRLRDSVGRALAASA